MTKANLFLYDVYPKTFNLTDGSHWRVVVNWFVAQMISGLFWVKTLNKPQFTKLTRHCRLWTIGGVWQLGWTCCGFFRLEGS